MRYRSGGNSRGWDTAQWAVANRVAIVLILFVAAVFTYIGTAHREWVHDDLCYEYVYDANEFSDSAALRPVESMADVMESQLYHYQHINGRMPLHILVQTFAGPVGQPLYAVANALMLVLFIILTVRLTFGTEGRRNPLAWIAVTIALYYLLPPAAGIRTAPWLGLSVSLNYLWAGALFEGVTLMFMRRQMPGPAYTFAAILLAFLSGWSNEAFSVPMAGAFLLLWMFGRRIAPSLHITPARRAMIIAQWAGTAFIVFSPGTLTRIMRDTDTQPLFDKVVSAVVCYIEAPVVAVCLLLAAVILLVRRFKPLRLMADSPLAWLILLVGIPVSFYAHSYSHSVIPEALMAIILTIRMITALCGRTSVAPRASLWLSAVLLALFGAHQWAVAAADSRALAAYRQTLDRLRSPESHGVAPLHIPSEPWWLSPFTDSYLAALVTPAHETAGPLSHKLGIARRPLIVTKADYDHLVARRDAFFTPANRINGTAGAYVGEHFYVVPEASDSTTVYVAEFGEPGGPDFTASLNWAFRTFYRTTGMKKGPKELLYENVVIEGDTVTLVFKVLSTPSSLNRYQHPQQ